MSDACRRLILERIRQDGPLSFADFMEMALYHPEAGYYATAARRSGRLGDFYTSVDVGPVFGEFLARQFAEMGQILAGVSGEGRVTSGEIDLVEAGAGNGRLTRDVLETLETIAPGVYERVRAHLVERSAPAREAHPATLGRHASKLASSSADLPRAIDGILFANELLDALPTHAVVCRGEGLREIVIDAVGDRLVERDSPASPAIEEYLGALGVRLAPGWRAEVNLQAIEWMRAAARALRRGFLVLVDYGHEARVLYSASHVQGTLSTFTGHVVETFDERRNAPPWLRDPGSGDITAHVDFTSIRNAAGAEGLDLVCLADQMHFLLGLGVEEWLLDSAGSSRQDLTRRLALKTLLVPGGLGTTHHVMIFGRNIGRPALKGCR